MNSAKIYLIIILSVLNLISSKAQKNESNFTISYTYSPNWWQTNISLPESPRKSLVGKNGQLMYEFPAFVSDPKTTKGSGFATLISFMAGENEIWESQNLLKAEVPLVITQKEWKDVLVTEETFAVAPLLFGEADSSISDFLGNSLTGKITGRPGNDIIIITFENKGSSAVSLSPGLKISSVYPVKVDTSKGKVYISDFLRVIIPCSITESSTVPAKKGTNEKGRNLTTVTLKNIQLAAGEKTQLAFGVSQGFTAIDCPNNVQQALHLRKQSIAWWKGLSLPYNKINVPDPAIQSLLNASIRNIYQNIDLENNLPVLKTGPASNRQFLIPDAPFIVEALTLLNQTEDAKNSIAYLLSLQKKDGSFQQQEKDWKETGMVLWALANYARLSGDRQWLESVWPQLEKGFNFLIELRNSTLQNTKASYAGLIPPGSGSEGQGIDYVNNYWALSGLNSAITAARWVGRNGQAIKWQSQYDDYYKVFQESVKKNMKKDPNGNLYLPVRVSNDKKTPPQKSQWSFLNAVYPGKIFDLNDPVLAGNMKMLERSTKEGLLYNTGWMNNGIMAATASDYAHTLQWTGNGQEAAKILYAMANHASSNMAWFEQQSLKAGTDTFATGDMPNSRVSAEFIRTIRHLIIMERNYELHLFEGVPAAWTKPGMEIKLKGVLTEFGVLDFNLKISDDGTKAIIDLNLDSTNRRTPQRMILHLDGISGNPATIDLEIKPNLHKVLNLN